MLTYRLTNLTECASISALLTDIDCKLFSLSKHLYSNIVFALNKPVNSTLLSDLLTYKRILQFKTCNPEYAGCCNLDSIAGKVKLLIHK